MSSNVVKSFYTIKESSAPRVIESNSKVEQVMERIRTEIENGESAQNFEWNDFGQGSGELQNDDDIMNNLDPDALNALMGDNPEGNVSGNVIKSSPAPDVGAAREKMLAEVEAERQRLTEEAQADAAMLRNLAAEEIARDKSMALEMGRQEGYEAGMNQAMGELEKMKQELEMERRHLEQQYEDMMFDLEPQFIRHITNIYEKVFLVDLSDKKDIVLNVLQNAMQKIEGSKNYIVHVSKEDFSFVNERKSMLAEATLATDVTVDIVEDVTMRQGDCMIETANGIFDCGIDTQLSAIKNRLVLLSYNGRD